MFRAIFPNILTVEALKGILAGSNTVEQMTPCAPNIRTSDALRPRADRCRGIDAQTIAHWRQREPSAFFFSENAHGGERPQQPIERAGMTSRQGRQFLCGTR